MFAKLIKKIGLTIVETIQTKRANKNTFDTPSKNSQHTGSIERIYQITILLNNCVIRYLKPIFNDDRIKLSTVYT